MLNERIDKTELDHTIEVNCSLIRVCLIAIEIRFSCGTDITVCLSW